MPLTLSHLTGAFPDWEIHDAAGGGWYAIRTVLVPPTCELSNIRCGANLDELSKNLTAETRHPSHSAEQPWAG